MTSGNSSMPRSIGVMQGLPGYGARTNYTYRFHMRNSLTRDEMYRTRYCPGVIAFASYRFQYETPTTSNTNATSRVVTKYLAPQLNSLPHPYAPGPV